MLGVQAGGHHDSKPLLERDSAGTDAARQHRDDTGQKRRRPDFQPLADALETRHANLTAQAANIE